MGNKLSVCAISIAIYVYILLLHELDTKYVTNTRTNVAHPNASEKWTGVGVRTFPTV
jgi:hypothetical protein